MLLIYLFICLCLKLSTVKQPKDISDYVSFYLYPSSKGHYKVSEVLVQKTPLVPISCFKSTTARIQSPVRNNIPGPGTYNPYQPPEPVKRTVLP